MKKFSTRIVGVLIALSLSACGGGSPETAEQPVQVVQANVQHAQVRMGSSIPSATVAVDTLKIAGYRSAYTVVRNEGGTITVTNNLDKTSTTYTSALTLIKFVDKNISFQTEGISGDTYRLYQAAFNRKPDISGQGFWTHAANAGLPLTQMAQNFYDSDEFKRTYGTVSDGEFVELLYNNVLRRHSEPGGFKFWTDALKNGTSRAQVLANFSTSAENKTNVAPSISQGIEYVPFQEDTTIRVLRTSYLNAKTNQGNHTIPVSAGGNEKDGFAYFHAYGFADFFQDNSYSMITASNEYMTDPNATAATAKTGRLKFWKKDEKGNWVDHTKDLLADDTGCILARKVVVADFNGDGKPDVFLSCHGFDAEPFPGERQRLVLSQANGTYKNTLLDVNCFCHGAAAADFDDNGFADIVVADFLGGKGAYFLKNNKDGTFTVDNTRLPQSIKNKGAIFSTEIVDVNNDGKLDVFLAGNESQGWATTAFINDGTNHYSNAKALIFPADPAMAAPLDIVVAGNAAYILRSNSEVSGSLIQKVDLTTMQANTIYSNTGYYPGQPLKWVDWITVSNGAIVSVNSIFNIVIKI
jgi:hypothetical protein